VTPAPDPALVERDGRLEVRSPLRVGTRLLFVAFGVSCLLAPYELILRVPWQSYLNPAFIVAALISAVALALSTIALFAALAGRSSLLVFDARAGTLRYETVAPIVRRAERVVSLADVDRVEVVSRDWSDGWPSHSLRIVLVDGSALEGGASQSLEGTEAIRRQVERLLHGAEAR
jgi:hypothetical protein